MISDVTKYVEFLATNKLSEHQFLILWLVHTKDKDNIALYRKKLGNFDKDAILDLIDRGWIDDFGTIKDGDREYNIYNFLVTDKFTKVVVVDEEDAYEELKKVYPKWFNINGKDVPSVSGDPIKLAALYRQYGHKGNRLEHERIVEITRVYHMNKGPMVKLENYITNKMWDLLEEKIPGGGKNDAFTVL